MAAIAKPAPAEPELEQLFGSGLLTVEEAQTYLNISPRTIDRLIARRAFTVVRIGKTVRVPKRALAVYLQGLVAAAEAPPQR